MLVYLVLLNILKFQIIYKYLMVHLNIHFASQQQHEQQLSFQLSFTNQGAANITRTDTIWPTYNTPKGYLQITVDKVLKPIVGLQLRLVSPAYKFELNATSNSPCQIDGSSFPITTKMAENGQVLMFGFEMQQINDYTTLSQ
eukprot:UN05841